MKKIKRYVATLVLSSFFTVSVYGNTKVFVDGHPLNHAKIENGTTYVQLKELEHYIDYELAYDTTTSTVQFYKANAPKPVIQKEVTVFPVNVEELIFEDSREIVKVYELSQAENPKEIPIEPFEKNGYIYTLTDVTKSNTSGEDQKEHSEVVTLHTTTSDVNQILKQIKETMEYESEDGYKGVLQLDLSSIDSGVKGYKNTSYTITEHREYPNLSSADTSLVPKTIQANGKTLSISNISWKTSSATTVDYEQLSETYTAVATYSGTGTKSSATGYTTTATYGGTLSKTIVGKTIYTAYFTGQKIKEEIKEPTQEELQQQLKEVKAKKKAEQRLEGVVYNPWIFVYLVVGISILASVIYLLFFMKNSTVFTLVNGKFQKIGKVRMTKKVPIIDLTTFTSKVTSPSFILVLNRYTAKRMDGQTITINYGDSSFQHIVTIVEDTKEKRDYQIEVDF